MMNAPVRYQSNVATSAELAIASALSRTDRASRDFSPSSTVAAWTAITIAAR